VTAYQNSKKDKKSIQRGLASLFGVSSRTIRSWAKWLDVGSRYGTTANILVYDIETSKAKFECWWTGKQYVSHKQMLEEPKIISISWKWIGEDECHFVDWGEDQCDRKVLEKFLPAYNDADMIIGQNNDNFDNRWVNARAAKFNMFVNVYPRSFDIMKQCKRLFRLPSYSMDFLTKYFDVNHKMKHEGDIMWQMIERGTPEQKREYLDKMKAYNVNDIVSTEALYHRLNRYMRMPTHTGVLSGYGKSSCPVCAGTNVSINHSTVTSAGTIQHVMRCNDDQHLFKISNTQYNKFCTGEL
jgi:DNA polymerase elongation subunit (family B)